MLKSCILILDFGAKKFGVIKYFRDRFGLRLFEIMKIYRNLPYSIEDIPSGAAASMAIDLSALGAKIAVAEGEPGDTRQR